MSRKRWIGKPSPKSMHMGRGWFGELNKTFTDGEYAVMSRTIQTEWGLMDHVCIRNKDNTDISWLHKQTIKNELYGEERTAIEVFPAVSDLVDEANMYHLWILPKGMKLPFSLKE